MSLSRSCHQTWPWIKTAWRGFAAEHCLTLNPRDGNAVALMGILTGYAGDWQRGVEWTTRAMAMNPHHPGWYRFITFFDSYHRGEYAEGLEKAGLAVRQP